MKIPILHLPTISQRAGLLKVAFDFGYEWYSDLDYSLKKLDERDASWHNDYSYAAMLVSGNVPGGFVQWINRRAAIDFLTDDTYTLLNSPAHLRVYLSRRQS